MNKDELKGKLENLKGRVKEAAESLSGKDKHAGSEGSATERIKQAGERSADAAREKAGEIKRDASPDVEESEDE
jgi:hypothetical protein